MSFTPIWPSNRVRSIIDAIREAIGRVITIYVNVSGTACSDPGCSLDPVTNLSTNQFCVTCGGNYWIATTSAWACSAHVRWRSAEQLLWATGGIIDEGDCKVTIAYSGDALHNVQNSDYFIVDGRDMYMKNYRLKGVQPVNRIAITLLEDKE